jgi:hypothetical protein
MTPSTASLIERAQSLHLAGDPLRAIEDLSQAVASEPTEVKAYQLLALLLAAQGELDTSIQLVDVALELAPHDPVLLFHAGRIREQRCDFTDATPFYRRALSIRPTDDRTRFHLALNLLSTGSVTEGAAHYVARPSTLHPDERIRSLPRWDGTQKADTVFLWAEQGVGDEIMFLRFLPVIPELHRRLIIEVDARLQRLYEDNFPGVRFVSRGWSLDHVLCQAQAPVGDLLCLFHGRMQQPDFRSHVLGVQTDGEVSARLRHQAGPNRSIVGISWLTMSPERALARCLPIAQLLTSLDPSRHALVNLQYLAPADDLRCIRQLGFELLELGDIDPYQHLSQLATVIAAVDQVLCIGNTTAHLAGTIGQDTLVLLPKLASWRWQASGSSTAWYPNVTVTRQEREGDWQSALDEAKVVLSRGQRKEAASYSSSPTVSTLRCSAPVARPLPARAGGLHSPHT